jgi:hypothetical protein
LVFASYKAGDFNSESAFFSAVYHLNNLFVHDLEPENSGYLEDEAKEHLKPLLNTFYKKYPEAVLFFAKTFGMDFDENRLGAGNNNEVFNDSLKLESLFEESQDTEKVFLKKIRFFNDSELISFTEFYFNNTASSQIKQRYFDILVFEYMKRMNERIQVEGNNKSYGAYNDRLFFDGFWGVFMNNAHNNEGNLSVSDKFFKSYVSLSENFPELINITFDLIGQDAQVFHKNIFIEGLSELLVSESLGGNFKESVISTLDYLLTFEDYESALLESLDFSNVKKFFKTSMLLEMLKKVIIFNDDNGYFAGDASQKVVKVLVKIYESNSGSYLLNLRLGEVLNELRD